MSDLYVYVGVGRQDLTHAIPGRVADELGPWLTDHGLSLRDVRDKLAQHLRWVEQAIDEQAIADADDMGVPC